MNAPSSPAALAFRELRGNAKRIIVELNAQHLRIVGNDNHIIVYRNCGQLEVLGNANRVRVLTNPYGGFIKCSGNGGRVYLCDADVAKHQRDRSDDQPRDDVDDACHSIVQQLGNNCAVRVICREKMLQTMTTGVRLKTATATDTRTSKH